MKFIVIVLFVILFILSSRFQKFKAAILALLEKRKYKLPNEIILDMVRIDPSKKNDLISWFQARDYSLKRKFEFGSVSQLHLLVRGNQSNESFIDLLTKGEDAVGVLAEDKVELDGGNFDDIDNNFLVLFPDQTLSIPTSAAELLRPCKKISRKQDKPRRNNRPGVKQDSTGIQQDDYGNQEEGSAEGQSRPVQNNTPSSNSCLRITSTKFKPKSSGIPLNFIQGHGTEIVSIALIDSRTEFNAFAEFEESLDMTDPYRIYISDPVNKFDGLNLLIPDEHGTFMASIMAARYEGEAKLKISNYPFHDGESGHLMELIAAIYSAADKGVDIINLSLGYQNEKHNPHLRRAIKYAGDQNCLVICAAGNLNSDNDKNPYWPANFSGRPHVISVAAVNASGNAWKESANEGTNFGATKVNLASDGVSVEGFVNAIDEMTLSGTSCAAAIISSLAANLKSGNPMISAVDLKILIMDEIGNGAVFPAPHSSMA